MVQSAGLEPAVKGSREPLAQVSRRTAQVRLPSANSA